MWSEYSVPSLIFTYYLCNTHPLVKNTIKYKGNSYISYDERMDGIPGNVVMIQERHIYQFMTS